MKKTITIIFAFVFMSSILVKAQIAPLSTLWGDNRILINPASAGDKEMLTGNLYHRNELIGINESPVSNTISVHSPLTNKLRLGGIVNSFEQGIFKQLSANLMYAYSVDINADHKLAFGLGVGYYQNRIDFSGINVQDQSELAALGNVQNGSAINIDFGLRYNYDKLEFGFAMPRLMENKLNQANPNDPRYNTQRRNMNSHISYDYKFEGLDLTVSPRIMMNLILNGYNSFDFLANVDWRKLAWLGLGYRTTGHIIFNAGTWLVDNVGLTYSYNLSSSVLAQQSFGSHEIGVQVNFGKKKFNPYENRTPEMQTNLDNKKLDTKLEYRSQRQQKRDARQRLRELEKGSSRKVIIKTDGYDPNTGATQDLINIQVAPDGKVNTSGSASQSEDSQEVQELRGELNDIKDKLSVLLEKDLTDEDYSRIEDEILRLRLQLNKLLDENTAENTNAVSSEIEEITGQIEQLRAKLR